jgi:hypothetical protein
MPNSTSLGKEFRRGCKNWIGFKATEGASEKVWGSVGSLLHGVFEAFLVSIVAISLAMGAHSSRKMILTS